jgi:hypothetical protein
MCFELGITHGSGFHECVPKCVPGLENCPDVVAFSNPLELIRDALHIGMTTEQIFLTLFLCRFFHPVKLMTELMSLGGTH